MKQIPHWAWIAIGGLVIMLLLFNMQMTAPVPVPVLPHAPIGRRQARCTDPRLPLRLIAAAQHPMLR